MEVIRRSGVVHLVGAYTSEETIKLLKDLAAKAERGEITGVAFVALEKSHISEYGVSGTALSNPELSIGALCRLIRELNQHADSLTT